MEQITTKNEDFVDLQKKLKAKTKKLPLTSPQIVKLSQKIDKYIVQATKKNLIKKID